MSLVIDCKDKFRVGYHAPQMATKQLKLKEYSDGRRKAVCSSNLLALFNFYKGATVVERVIGRHKGFTVELVEDMDLLAADEKPKIVYSREYKHRRNNNIELLVETASKRIIEEAIPENCTHVHITMTAGKLVFEPVLSPQLRAIQNANNAKDRYSAFCACSSGVDMASMRQEGFSIHSVIEWRAPEKRDKTDLTETGAMTVAHNISGIKAIYNENIMEFNFSKLVESMLDDPFMVFHASPQCDEFTPLKSPELREKALLDLSTTIDMGLDMIRAAHYLAPPIMVLENVLGWVDSDIFNVVSTRLQRYGYTPYISTDDARDFGGLTPRPRAYCVFTALGVPFRFEEKRPRRTETVRGIIEKHLPNMRDVTHSKSLTDGIACGRLRPFTMDSTHFPTIVKSQDRMAKDSVVLRHEGRLYWPTEEMLKEIQGIPEDFSLACVSGSIASEIIGQSIDVPHHSSVMRAVKNHIDDYFASKGVKAA